ncbi:hypothetical protein TWF730_002798 [Orbilia blumenaviensis]|uniref:Uncharacterized protein n=1 Tax=Orbilia blumenaviensis TaxID=1796055 RepID=A0AAV9U8R2_9PEZI
MSTPSGSGSGPAGRPPGVSPQRPPRPQRPPLLPVPPIPPIPSTYSSSSSSAPPRPTLTNPFVTTPQPHFHRTWHSKCLHSQPTVRVPFGPEVEHLPSEARYVWTNNHRLCMCDSVDPYYLEEVEQGVGVSVGGGMASFGAPVCSATSAASAAAAADSASGGDKTVALGGNETISRGGFVERDVVEEYWRFLERENKAEKEGGKKKKGMGMGIIKRLSGGGGGLGSPGGKKSGEVSGSFEMGRRKVFRWVPRWRRVEGVCRGCAE